MDFTYSATLLCIKRRAANSYAGESSRTTHGTKAAVDACPYFAGLIAGASHGRRKSELLSAYFFPGEAPDFWQTHSLEPKIGRVAAGSFKIKEPPQIERVLRENGLRRDLFGFR